MGAVSPDTQTGALIEEKDTEKPAETPDTVTMKYAKKMLGP